MPRTREPELLDHDFDGIQEWDNPTPGWWHLLFITSVFFSALYAVFWHSSPMSWTPQDELTSEQQAYYGKLFKELGDLEPDRPTIVKLMNDEKWMAFGSTVYAANCAQCHAADGSGINGPNLTDDHWINVKALEDLFAVITDGVGAKGMPSWKNRLSEKERILVASYVATLRQKPVNGRPPEGDVIGPWATSETASALPIGNR